MGRVRGRLASESLDSLPVRELDRFPTWTLKLKPYIEKSLGTLEPRIMHKFQIADTYSFSLSAPALAPCAECQGSSPSSGFSRF